MKIKDVEARVGIKKTNIRFYEKEGLLNPGRSEENNYREYSEEDVARLKQIKALRMLDIPTADIRLLFDGEAKIQEVMERRIENIDREEKQLQEMRVLCNRIISEQLELDSMNEEIFEEHPVIWRNRLQEILARDIVEEKLDKKQFNKNMLVMLLWGYFISMIVTIVFIAYERAHDIVFWGEPSTNIDLYLVFGLGVISIISILMVYFTANVKIHLITFHLSALTLTPVLIWLIRWISYYVNDITRSQEMWMDPLADISIFQFIGFWILMMGYVTCLFILSKKWDKLFTKVRYTVAVTLGFAAVCTGLFCVSLEQWIMAAVVITYLTLLTGVKWTTALLDRQTYNRYYAVRQAEAIMNFIGLHTSQLGRGNQGAWLK